MALIDNKERIVEESRIQKVGSRMATIKISERSLSNFDDKMFYVNKIKKYPLDKNLYLFKIDLINKVKTQLYKDRDRDLRSSFTNKDKDVDKLIKNIKELNINSNRELIEAAIRLYNELL